MNAHPRYSVALVFLSVAAGCGKSDGTYPVRGKITLADGTALAGASVTFLSSRGISAVSRADSEGNYAMHQKVDGVGLPPGEYRVAVTEPFSGDIDAPSPPKIHPKYADASTSGLSWTVEPQANQFDIVLDPP